MMKITVKSEISDKGKRADVFLSAKIANLSRSQIQKLIEKGALCADGRTVNEPNWRLKGEAVFELEYDNGTTGELIPQEIPLEIIFEDEHILVINKSPGIAVHPGAGDENSTIVNALANKFANFAASFADKSRPGIVHRLDKDTSGCLLIAKNEKVREILSKDFASRRIEKIYLAMSYGAPAEKDGSIDTFFGRHPVARHKMAVLKGARRRAITDYKVLKEFLFNSQKCALLELKIKTGRTHQIRVHMAHIRAPILGDKIYGGKQKLAVSRQMLHAWKLKLKHPIFENELSFESPLPQDMLDIANPVIS